MALAQLVPLVLQVSVALLVFCIALQAAAGDVTYLLRRPSLLIRSVLAMSVVMPILAALIAAGFSLRPEIEVALVLLSVSPVPPILPRKQGKVGGNVSYGIGLLAVSAVVALVSVPASVKLIARLFGHQVDVPVAVVAKVVGISVLLPLAAGVVVRSLAPSLAGRLAKPLSLAGSLALMLMMVVVLAGMWRTIVGLFGDFTVVAIVLFTLVSLAVGHLLGGPVPEDRTVLGLSTASRHPGVAIAVASAIAADRTAVPAVAAAVLLCVLIGIVVTGPYAKWRKRTHEPAGPRAVPAG